MKRTVNVSLLEVERTVRSHITVQTCSQSITIYMHLGNGTALESSSCSACTSMLAQGDDHMAKNRGSHAET